MRRRLQGRRKCVSVATATVAMIVGDRCKRQECRNLETDATTVASTTVVVTSTWLGDLAVAAAAVTLGDVAGGRERTAVLALMVGHVVVVACGVASAGGGRRGLQARGIGFGRVEEHWLWRWAAVSQAMHWSCDVGNCWVGIS